MAVAVGLHYWNRPWSRSSRSDRGAGLRAMGPFAAPLSRKCRRNLRDERLEGFAGIFAITAPRTDPLREGQRPDHCETSETKDDSNNEGPLQQPCERREHQKRNAIRAREQAFARR